MINPINKVAPTNPKLLAKTANIKSVCGSGNYIGVFLNPFPNKPPEAIAVIPFSS